MAVRRTPAGCKAQFTLPFRKVNRPGCSGYRQSMQRHHLLPIQLLSRRWFGSMFGHFGRFEIDFDDFRTNGMLLPANEGEALRWALPMHRGPHATYNEMVGERVGQIEARWSSERLKEPEKALETALFRLAILQRGLRTRLMSDVRRLKLNRSDPLGAGRDFSHLDAMADELWRETDG